MPLLLDLILSNEFFNRIFSTNFSTNQRRSTTDGKADNNHSIHQLHYNLPNNLQPEI